MRIVGMGLAFVSMILASPAKAQFFSVGPVSASMWETSLAKSEWRHADLARPGYSRSRPNEPNTVLAPRGFMAMCARSPDVCRSEAEPIASELSARAKLRLLSHVTRRVNRQVRPQAERGDGPDQWVRPGRAGVGDCEDYAIEKREQLRAAGFPSDDLTFAVVYRRDIGLHTVLVARIGSQDYVLDNLSPWVIRAGRIPYTWVKRQERADNMHWTSVLPPRNTPITQAKSPTLVSLVAS